jgi:hypothetical protein
MSKKQSDGLQLLALTQAQLAQTEAQLAMDNINARIAEAESNTINAQNTQKSESVTFNWVMRFLRATL